MLKKVLSSIFVLLFVLSLCGCKKPETVNVQQSDTPKVEEKVNTGVKGTLINNLFKTDDGMVTLSIPENWYLKATLNYRTEIQKKDNDLSSGHIILVSVPTQNAKPFEELNWDYFQTNLTAIYNEVTTVSFEKIKLAQHDVVENFYTYKENNEICRIYEYTIYTDLNVYTLTYKFVGENENEQKIVAASIESFSYTK